MKCTIDLSAQEAVEVLQQHFIGKYGNEVEIKIAPLITPTPTFTIDEIIRVSALVHNNGTNRIQAIKEVRAEFTTKRLGFKDVKDIVCAINPPPYLPC